MSDEFRKGNVIAGHESSTMLPPYLTAQHLSLPTVPLYVPAFVGSRKILTEASGLSPREEGEEVTIELQQGKGYSAQEITVHFLTRHPEVSTPSGARGRDRGISITAEAEKRRSGSFPVRNAQVHEIPWPFTFHVSKLSVNFRASG